MYMFFVMICYVLVLVLAFGEFVWPILLNDDVIRWKHFPRYWPFVREIHRSPVNFPHKDQWHGTLMLSFICLNKQLSKQSWGWWFETSSRPLWRHSNDIPRAWFIGIGATGNRAIEWIPWYECHSDNPAVNGYNWSVFNQKETHKTH